MALSEWAEWGLAKTRVEITTPLDLAQRIEQSVYWFESGDDPEDMIDAACDEALDELFRAVVVRPEHVPWAKEALAESPIQVVAVIGYPVEPLPFKEEITGFHFGNVPLDIRLEQIAQAIAGGANELEVLLNFHLFVSHHRDRDKPQFQYDLVSIVDAAGDCPLRVNIETNILLADDEISSAAQLVSQSGATGIVTGTGMLTGGRKTNKMEVKDLYHYIRMLDNRPMIKANGGIISFQQAWDMLQAGADWIGTTRGAEIMDEYRMVAKS